MTVNYVMLMVARCEVHNFELLICLDIMPLLILDSLTKFDIGQYLLIYWTDFHEHF